MTSSTPPQHHHQQADLLHHQKAAAHEEEQHHRTPHIVAIPYPLPGHITALLRLATSFASSGFSITFLVTHRYQSHLANILPDHLLHYDRPLHGIRLISVHDGVHHFDSPRSLDDFRDLLVAYENSLRSFVEPIVEQLVSAAPPVVCILSDAHLGWTQDVADKVGVPRVAFWASLAAECQVYSHSSRLISAGYLPFTEASDEFVHIPGLPLLHRSDFPSFLQIQDSSDIFFQYFIEQAKRLPEAYMILVNSFFELEASLFNTMRADFAIHPVGPLFSLTEKVHHSSEHDSLIKEDNLCIRWLDKQPAKSVIYVAFGSTAFPTPALVTALATGLEASQRAFLWALLRFSEPGKTLLPEGFLDRTKGRGLVVGWAPQRDVLQHPSVGCFVSHCGWNSVLESIWFGVPVIGFPLGGDQPLICKLMVDEWGVGMGLKKAGKGCPASKDVERLTREVMEEGGEKGRELRRRCGEWSAAAKRAVESGGSSWATLEAVSEKLKKKKN